MAGVYGFTTDSVRKRIQEDRLIQLTDDDGTGTVDESKVSEAIVAGEEEFHLYASRYYAIPVTPCPDAVKEKILDLVAYRLMTLQPELLSEQSPDGTYWIRLRKELLHWLEGLSSERRTSVIPSAGENTSPVATGGRAHVVTDTPYFTEDNVKAF